MSDILCVTNRRQCVTDFYERVREIAESRPRGIILREKDLTEAEYKVLAADVISICSEYGTACILHNFYNAACELGARAIHLPLAELRKMSDTQKKMFTLIGASCHSAKDAVEAEKLGCTYITAGHIFDTDCKKGLPGRGLEFIREICAAVSVPVYGIGGIDADNVQSVRKAGVEGVCIMSGIMRCDDVRAYLNTIENAEGQSRVHTVI